MSIGRVIFDIEGLHLTAEDKSLLRHSECGGVIFFARQDAGPSAIKELTNEIREVNPHVVIAVDQEGGRVQRFKRGFTRLPKPSYFGNCWDKDPAKGTALAEEVGELMAKELKAVGVDISFAPVADRMCFDSDVLRDRVFSDTVKGIQALTSAFIKGMAKEKMPATLKHFPGHGGVSLDSHLILPEDKRSFESLQEDINIFKYLINKGAEAIMPAHIVFPEVDKMPVGFSAVWLKKILRGELKFDGIVFSDDLTMKATEAYGNYAQRSQLAIDAGCDFVLVCQNRAGAIESMNAIKDIKDCVDSARRREQFLSSLNVSVQTSSTVKGE
ncbi:MAG: beta-N-acetylhexosaminidase [Legionellales bacterium]|nr:beta-N-acetylhexosaminidase [Legionellales bacterium]|tara:strand:- start:359 stop:1342 length:984 start_codon:yes stop_codon:yes gene_type:complete